MWQCKWRHLVATFVTNASNTTCWPKLEPMQVTIKLISVRKMIQVTWIRCASGNVSFKVPLGIIYGGGLVLSETYLTCSRRNFCFP